MFFDENIKKIVEFRKSYKGKICIFGAGRNGRGIAKELVEVYMGLKVDFYCDNYLIDAMVDGLPVYRIDYIREKYDEVFFIISVANDVENIIVQLRELGFENYAIYNNTEDLLILSRYIKEKTSQDTQKMFWKLASDEEYLKVQYKKVFGTEPDLDSPKTFNEKMQWIKLHDHNPLYNILTDKYEVRSFISNRYGNKYLVPLVLHTDDPDEINQDNIPNYPIIIKTTASCHDYTIIREKRNVNWSELKKKYRKILDSNYYYGGREWHYKNISPSIVVEKLLIDSDGKIPNDYKLIFMNGDLKFVYCSIDREGSNYRKIYSPEWEPLGFSIGSDYRNEIKPDIAKPDSFEKMVEIGSDIAKMMPFVRMDFYDLEGELYFGEVTLCHGCGFDKFYPQEYDLFWGSKLVLPCDP